MRTEEGTIGFQDVSDQDKDVCKPLTCADPESFVRGGPNLIIFFS